MRIPRPQRRSSKSGIALIIVMAVILSLTVLAGGFAYTMRVEMTLARNANYDEEMEWLGRSGVEIARWMLAEKAKIPCEANVEALNQEWNGAHGCSSNSIFSDVNLKDIQLVNEVTGQAGKLSITITDAERKWNINWVCYPGNPQLEVMQRAMNVIGVADPTVGSAISDAICDWIDTDDNPRLSGGENTYYMGLNPPYYCKNGYIDDMSELLLIKGIWDQPEIFWGSNSTNHPMSAHQMKGYGRLKGPPPPQYPHGLNDLFTAVSNSKININTASREVLMMIPGMDPQAADGIIEARSGFDHQDGTDDDVPFQNVGQISGANIQGSTMTPIQAQGISRFCDVRSYTFEVEVDAEMNGYQRQYFALIRRGGQRAGDLQVFKFYWK